MNKVSENIFDAIMFPFELIHFEKRRRKITSMAKGKVLEVGSGTGSNFGFFNYKKIEELTVFDMELTDKVKKFRFPQGFNVKYVEGSVEDLMFEDDSFDNVVFSLVFCSVNDPYKGLKEVFRVLKPGGRIYFIEHVLPRNDFLQKIINIINPTWSKIAMGCNLNRNTIDLIKKAGFTIEEYNTYYNGLFIDGIGLKELK